MCWSVHDCIEIWNFSSVNFPIVMRGEWDWEWTRVLINIHLLHCCTIDFDADICVKNELFSSHDEVEQQRKKKVQANWNYWFGGEKCVRLNEDRAERKKESCDPSSCVSYCPRRPFNAPLWLMRCAGDSRREWVYQNDEWEWIWEGGEKISDYFRCNQDSLAPTRFHVL